MNSVTMTDGVYYRCSVGDLVKSTYSDRNIEMYAKAFAFELEDVSGHLVPNEPAVVLEVGMRFIRVINTRGEIGWLVYYNLVPF